ncbi:TPA: hypothetical protein L4V00_001808 [Pseudomonas aeruginosa]|nr:hypothetical protein [Pseudomonas aeruginosa]HBO4704395.1 hypothetical protein [Pseudomonas aeruginosa]
MISRYKWYQVRLPCSISEFFSKLALSAYNNASSTGFLAQEDESSFRYIWPSTINAVRLDSEGNAEYEQIVTINSQSVVVLGEKSVVFRFENPSRSMREVLNALERAVGFGFACEQIVFTDSLVQKALSNGTSKILNSLKVSGAIPEASALARVELASKEGIREENVKLLGLGEFVVEAASYEVSYKGLKGQVGFSRAAACKVSGLLAPFILANIETALLDNH